MDSARRAHRDGGAQGENTGREGELRDDPATADGPAANHRGQPHRARTSKKRRRSKRQVALVGEGGIVRSGGAVPAAAA